MRTCPVCGASGQPLLADWCCGAGGAGRGYQLAGFHVVGYDLKVQPRYPGCFVQADVMEAPLGGFDAYHASPPCVDHAHHRLHWAAQHGTGWLLAAVRSRLQSQAQPWVIENVPGSPVRPDYRVCGCMYGLADERWQVIRERWFETSWGGFALRQPCVHTRPALTVVRAGAHWIPGHGDPKRYVPLPVAARLMGIDWMTARELGLAVPPAYTADIGADLMAHLEEAA